MAWIKVEHNLATKVEVFQLCRLLQIKNVEAVGHLVNFWIWADQNSEDGQMIGDLSMIDGITMEGFGKALTEVNWLTEEGNQIIIPNFLLHNGSSAKARAVGGRRVAKFRKLKKFKQIPSNPSIVSIELLDKIREDKKRNTNNIVDIWNDTNQGKLPKVQAVSSKRKTLIAKIQKTFSDEDIKQVFEKVQKIPFMTGDNERKWVASFDYVMREDSFIKILEGGWDSQIKPTRKEWELK